MKQEEKEDSKLKSRNKRHTRGCGAKRSLTKSVAVGEGRSHQEFE